MISANVPKQAVNSLNFSQGGSHRQEPIFFSSLQTLQSPDSLASRKLHAHVPSEAYAGKPRDGLGICEVAAKFLEEEGSQDTLVLGSLALRWQTDAVKCEPLPVLVAWLAFGGGWVFFCFRAFLVCLFGLPSLCLSGPYLNFFFFPTTGLIFGLPSTG